MLTPAEQPDAAKISTQISEIARPGAQQRMDYVRAIGEAVGVHQDAQRQAIVASTASSMPAARADSPMDQKSPPAAGAMKMTDRPTPMEPREAQ